MWQHENLLRDLFDVPESRLPAQLPRRADWTTEPPHIAEGLTRIFAPLLKRYETLPDVFVRKSLGTYCPINAPHRVIVSPGAGMFAVVNAVVNMFNLHDQGKMPAFRIDDENFLFGNWSDFFQHPFAPMNNEQTLAVNGYTWEFTQPRRKISVEEAESYPHKTDGHIWRNILLPPEDRKAAHRIISKYLVLEPSLDAQIKHEINAAKIENCLALHIRGPGRLHGGVDWMLWKMGYSGVPFEEYFKQVDTYIAKHDVDIFAFSDASDVIRKVQDKYGDRVKYRKTSQLAKEGEGHHDDSLGDKIKLGKDVITECYMMAHAKHLIHGNSNVTNFALCANPLLSHQDIYQKLYNLSDS